MASSKRSALVELIHEITASVRNSSIKIFFIALSCCAISLAWAAKPTVITKDKNTYLDLTTKENKLFDLDDCYLRIEGIPPRRELVNKTSRILIPPKAFYNDSYLRVKAHVLGLPISSMVVAQVKPGETLNWEYGALPLQLLGYEAGMTKFLANRSPQKATEILLKKLPKHLVISSIHNKQIDRGVISIFNNENLLGNVPYGDGWAYEKELSTRKTSMLEHFCNIDKKL